MLFIIYTNAWLTNPDPKEKRVIAHHTNSNRIRSFTELYFTPLRLCSGTARMPLQSSITGRHVCPAKSSFSDMSYSWTSIRSNASSGTLSGNSNTSSQFGIQLSSSVFVFFMMVSAGTPAIPTLQYTQIIATNQKIDTTRFASLKHSYMEAE